MKNKRKFKISIFLILGILLLAGLIFLIIYLNKNNNEYSFNEKKWISSNLGQVIDIYIEDNMPIFAYNGEGVFLDYLEALESDTSLKFNINYNEEKSYNFVNKNKIDNNELVLFKDHYVLVSSNIQNIGSIKKIVGKTIGVLSEDMTISSSYFADITNISLKSYDNYDTLFNALEEKEISFALIPLYKNLSSILNRDYSIELHLDDLYSYYSFSNKSNDVVLTNIMRKFYNRWLEKFEEKRNEHISSLYYEIKEYTELSKDSIVNDDYVVGYIQNLPFEGKINNTFTGLTNEYLERFSKLTGATYKYVPYKSIEKLNEALINKKVDIIANYYGINNTAYCSSKMMNSKEYVVLAHYTNETVMNSINSITNKNISLIDKLYLTNTIISMRKGNVTTYKDIKSLVRKTDKMNLIILDKSTYDYYKTKALKDYSIRFTGNYANSSNFLLLSKNTDFNNYFNFFISFSSSKEVEYSAVDATTRVLKNNIVLSFILNNIVYIIILIIALGLIIYKAADNVRISKKIKKEDKLMYLDMMTNLKNRNYLNDNLKYWEENKVYPQAIVIVDLNRIKELNDKEGHEAGDNQIKSAANALIKTQRDNSEIIRTDGNEFLIYLIGYEEKYIVSYIHRMNREFKAMLPYKDYGLAVGYSMITDELKTIDDAINEALIMMRDNKVNKSE